jgi:hypothetical protein
MVDIFHLGWNGLNTVQVQVLSPIIREYSIIGNTVILHVIILGSSPNFSN